MQKTKKCDGCGADLAMPEPHHFMLQDGVRAAAVLMGPLIECPKCRAQYGIRVIGFSWKADWVRVERKTPSGLVLPSGALPKLG